MAMEGLRPIAEIQFADFIYPAFNQIVGEAAKTRYRTNGEYTCPLVIRTPYGGGVRGALSHSVSIEALFYHVPGLKIVAPSFPADVKGLLNAAIDDPDPVLFLEHKKTYRLIKGEVPDGHYTIPLGKANVLKEGTQLTVVSYGLYVHWALEAAQQLCKTTDISVEVIDLRSIRPMDKTTILEQRRENAQAADHSRGQQVRRHRRGDQRDGRRRSALQSRRADPALCGPDVPAMGYARAARRRVHVVAGRDGRSDARNGEVLMATTITMPQLGETVTEGTVAQWLKKVGDSSTSTKTFVEVSTDKVNAEVPSPVTGVHPRAARQGRRDRRDRHADRRDRRSRAPPSATAAHRQRPRSVTAASAAAAAPAQANGHA